jgi:hypothetical protein
MFRPDVDASASRPLPDFVPSLGRLMPPAVPAGAAVAGPMVARCDGGEPRLPAAHLLERTLLRLGRAGTAIERHLAPGLSRMHGRRLYRLLGYVRLADYLTERLGMSLRRCQAILRLERALARLPRLAQALETGELSVSKVEVAAGAATAETEGTWIERAKSLPLAFLREAARAVSASGVTSTDNANSAGDATRDGDATNDRNATNEDSASNGTDVVVATSVAPASTFEQDEPGRFVFVTAPPHVLAIWHWTLDLVRRVAGQQEPAWRCAEYLAAEFLSGVPDAFGDVSRDGSGPARDGSAASAAVTVAAVESAVAAAADHPARAPCASAPLPDGPGGSSPLMAAWIAASDAVREALASFDASADLETVLAERPVPSDPDEDLDAWELDAHLRRLVRFRQSLAWRQGRLLATFASLRLYRDLGFDTFDDWVGDRLAMSPRRARYLVSLTRRLRGLPLLADAYRSGLVSWCQARLLVRVAQPATQSLWIRYARQVTVRRLEDAIVEREVGATNSSATSASAGPDASCTAAPAAPAHISAGPAHISASPSDIDRALAHVSASPPSSAESPPAGAGPATSDRRTWRRISFWCPLDVAALWDSALRSCRAAAGKNLEDWECFLLLVRSLRNTWENQEDPRWRRRYRILERDGWRCKAPGCTSLSGLNEHHITFRSQQGGDDPANLVTLCVGHHQQGLHAGHIRCFGRAPHGLWWDMGVRPGGEGEPLARYFGDRLVEPRPLVSVAPPQRVASATTAGG